MADLLDLIKATRDAVNMGQEDRRTLDGAPLLNPMDNKIALVLLVDTSASMEGEGIEGVNRGIQLLREKITQYDKAKKMVEIALVSFNSEVNVVHPFSSIEEFNPQPLKEYGLTSMGKGIITAMDLVEERKKMYRNTGTDYFRPWIFMITDGAATDMDITNTEKPQNVEMFKRVKDNLKDGVEGNHFNFFIVGAGDGVDIQMLNELADPKRPPQRLRRGAWDAMFEWLQESLLRLSKSKPGDEIVMPKRDDWTIS